MNRQQIIFAVDLLIAARDRGEDVQDAIDKLMDKVEALVEADPEFQAKQSAAAWGRACVNNVLWNN